MNTRNTVQCSGSIINPAGGDENDDHTPAGIFIKTWSKKTQGFAFWLDNQKIKTATEMNRLQFDLISLEYING